MILKRNFIWLLILVFYLTSSCATSKLEKQFAKSQYQSIIDRYGHSIGKNSGEENYFVAESYRKSNRIEKAAPFYRAALEKGEQIASSTYHLSRSLKAQKNYDEAQAILEAFDSSSDDSVYLELIDRELQQLTYLEGLEQSKNFYKLKNLEDINTPQTEYSPVYNDGKLYFVSNRNTERIYKNLGVPFTSIFQVDAKGALIDKKTLRKMPEVINQVNVNEGSMTFSKDGRTMIFAKGNDGKSKGSDDVNLYFSRFRNGRWSKPKLLEINEKGTWTSCPNLSPNGRTLYFASNRPGGYGGIDLYVASRDKRGRWTDVRNLGPKINTADNEMFPFLATDGVFYFSSDGHPGFGKQDVFKETRKSGQVIVENMGRPVNSEADDFGIFFFDEIRGFMSSNREGGAGDDDIYTFVNEDPDLKIVNYFLIGTVINKTDSADLKVKAAKVRLFAENGEMLDESYSNSDGKFKFRVYEEENYTLITEKEGFFTKRDVFTTYGKSVDRSKLKKRINNINFEIEIPLDPIVLDKSIVLEDIYYDFDKANIREDAALELDKLVQVLVDNPSISIELGSHTDARADEAYNDELSERRAKSAVEYIINRGISEKRISAKGYGESQLIIKDAKTEEEHQVNRRTEFKVTSYSGKTDQPNNKTTKSEDAFDKYFDAGDEF